MTYNWPEKLSDELMWFIGFSEGRTALCFLYRDEKRLLFFLTQGEACVLYKVRKILGFGSVRKDQHARFVRRSQEDLATIGAKAPRPKDWNRPYFRLVVSHREGIKKLIQLFNGRFVCQHRREQLFNWISLWNRLHPKECINYLESTAEPTLMNAWLSGFLDAEGGFSISIAPRSSTSSMKSEAKRFRVRPRVFCDQKNEKEVLVAIARAFQAGRVSARANDRTQFRWMVDTWKHVGKIKSYLNRYPLRTRKHLVYLRWMKIYYTVLRREHLTEHGFQKIRQLCTLLQKGPTGS